MRIATATPDDDPLDLRELEMVVAIASVDAQAADLLIMHGYRGLTIGQCASELAIHPRAAHRKWSMARSMVERMLQRPDRSRGPRA